ncbi:hypothetical protein EMIHUDRAFT_249981 [Emiliania huxleyi CCMP1516]|uniref:Uncharacterized protein n=2 Tax=Emiliania huxleyi TaxID=2903 RepID=A0A0D3I4R2_EMIH1|nr:hypothetical protein EMIHUDRAFT_249981 [Emiliania huxleyi CCMP1516]EOD06247.1 hypothetical protein EMIHUDRAFT_249981 [Emiliania huxleyi CCMP1516]|eukprot:XP_005758676.1 hypothetical protein EMIHUDRAFT_249981 [Emiliania huxleyi CCMP1516]
MACFLLSAVGVAFGGQSLRRPERCSLPARSLLGRTAAVSRRESLQLGAGLSATFLAPLAAPRAAFAAAQDPNDLSRLKKGLDSVQFLLDNWDRETVDPNSGADSPDRVRFFLGLRTTDHPLFQVDKLLIKAQKSLPDDVDFETWIDSVEGLNSHIAKINEAPAGPSTCTCPACAAGMWRSRYTRLAYTSSFGEYNPGGGKEQVRKYLLLAKEEVVQARDSLQTMVTLLKL